MKSLMCVHSGALRMPYRFVLNMCLAGIGVTSALAQQWVPDGRSITYVPEVSEDGTAYQFKFLSTAGVNYYIQSSEDLNFWTDGVLYRGLGNTITHPLFLLPQNDGGSALPEDPEEYIPTIHGSFRIQEIKPAGTTTGLLVTWVSLDDEQPKSYVLHGKDIEDNAPPIYSQDFDDYTFFIQFMGEITNLNDVPPSDNLGTNDSALIGKLVDSLPAINAEILANTAAQAAAPSPPPMVGAKKFYRIRQFYTDTDMDGLQDHLEEQQGTNMWNWDTDGDGISDSLDQNPLVNDAVADPDGAGLDASLDVDLLARYDFETLQGTFPNQTFEDKSGNNRHASPSGMSIDALGMVSKAGRTSGFGYAEGVGTTFQGKTNYALSFWACFDKDSIKNANTGTIRGLFGIYDYNSYVSPQQHVIKKYDLWGLRVERMADGTEQWKLGGHVYDNDTNNDGISDNPVTSTEHQTMSFTQPSGSIDDGKWHHIVVVREHPYLRVYIDGVLKKQEQKSVILLDHTAGITEFCFGRWMEYLPNTQFSGKFDRMRIYGRALSAADVDALHHQDIDRDGLWDISENRSLLWRDTNGDEIKQTSEYSYTINPYRHDAADTDHDGDGISSLLEQNNVTYPTSMEHPDSDGDLMPDGWELDNGLNPASPADGTSTSDLDQDGLRNVDEYIYGSDPNNANGDTDGDGTSDAAEVTQGSHPNDARDGGQVIPADERQTIRLGIGDKSGSHSEDYVLHVYRLDVETGQETRYYTLRSGGHGQDDEKTLSIFRKEDVYTFQIDWLSSNFGTDTTNNADGADFDYWFIVEPQNNDDAVLAPSFDPRIMRINSGESILGDKSDQTTFKTTIEVLRALLIPVRIIPDDGMAGTLGDEMHSSLAPLGERHFVTPKKNEVLTNTHVVFKAKNIRKEWFADLCEWEGGEPVAGNPHKRKVSRAAPNKEVLKIKYTATGQVSDKLNVWTVWCNGVVAQTGNLLFGSVANDTTIDGTSTTSAVARIDPAHRWKFKFAIQPASIVQLTVNGDFVDIPGGLEGFATVDPPGGNSEFTGTALSEGVFFKWDVSRRAKDRIINPNLIPKEKMSSGFGSVYDTQPLADSLAFDFPINDVVGNDDAEHSDEGNSPYDATAVPEIAHAAGEISSNDRPTIYLPYVGGQEGYTFEEHLLFGEFARLQIGDKWYRVSDFVDWKMVGKFKFTNGAWINNGSTTGLGN